MDAMAAIKQTFFQECEEQLGELETGLLAIQDGDADPETVNAVFRDGAKLLVRGAGIERAEFVGERLAARRVDATIVAGGAHQIGQHIREAGLDGDDMGGPAFEPVQICLDDLEIESAPSEHRFSIRFTPKPDLYAKANETALLMRELGRLGETVITCDFSRLPMLGELDPEGSYLSWTVELRTVRDETAVRDVFEFVEWDCELDIQMSDSAPAPDDAAFAALMQRMQATGEAGVASRAAPQAAPVAIPAAPLAANAGNAAQAFSASQGGKPEAGGPSQATIRVDLDRVDRLINLVGELVSNQAMLTQRVLEAGLARASGVASGLDELEQLTREIQDSVMAIRAQPVKSVFQRMPRLVREVAAMTGKPVRLVTEGENTEVDKTVIERLADPLTHMVRNAIDHGLESPEVRAAAGKPEEGLVHLSALHRSGRIVIEVSDDGAGIDRARVKELAASKGLIAAEAALSDEEIDNLIFLPGFSTVSAVSDISGRGVGMDVVRRSVQALGGRISIRSRPRQGSTFTMSLPLTLAVLDGMVVTVAGETLVVPLTAIVETLQPKSAEVHGFGGNARVIAIRDQFIPLIDVGRELDYRAGYADSRTGVALLVESGGHARSALLVDAILGQRQVVIKSLEANYRHVQGIAAATILGDGRVALILDVDAVVARSREAAAGFEQLRAAAG